MLVKNTEDNMKIAQVLASLAIEDMYVDEDFLKNVIELKKTPESIENLIRKTVIEYANN